jgi:hypothetical protein
VFLGTFGGFAGLPGAELCPEPAPFPDFEWLEPLPELALLEPPFVVECAVEDFFDEPAWDFEPALDFALALPFDPE